MTQLVGSVGREGLNRKTDVRLVQGLLNNYKIPNINTPLLIDGDAGNKTIKRIEAFQSKVLNKKKPDGRVDPNGQTFKKLINRPSSKFASAFKLSSDAIQLLHKIEGLATTPYDDQTGKDITQWVKGATIGYGHLIRRYEWSLYKNGISEKQADKLYQSDMSPFEEKVSQSVTSKILQQEYDALVIFIFNIGRTGFSNSSVLKLVNNPGANTSYDSLEDAWMVWNKSQGKVMRGLTNRRAAEWRIYSKGIYKGW